MKTLFLLDGMTGLRRGEVLALEWRDIDWLNGEVLVERAISKAKATDGVHKYRWVLNTTKGGRSRRVGLSPVVLESLRTLRGSLAEPPAGDSFIFTRGGTFIDPEYFTKWIAIPLVREATKGRVRRFHDLRQHAGFRIMRDRRRAATGRIAARYSAATPTCWAGPR
jgi:integrase